MRPSISCPFRPVFLIESLSAGITRTAFNVVVDGRLLLCRLNFLLASLLLALFTVALMFQASLDWVSLRVTRIDGIVLF